MREILRPFESLSLDRQRYQLLWNSSVCDIHHQKRNVSSRNLLHFITDDEKRYSSYLWPSWMTLGIKQWSDGSQSHQGYVERNSSQSEARTGCNGPIRGLHDVIIMSEVPLFYFQSSHCVPFSNGHHQSSYLKYFTVSAHIWYISIESLLADFKPFLVRDEIKFRCEEGWMKSTFVQGMMLSHSWIGD